MNTYFSVLPSDILQLLGSTSAGLDSTELPSYFLRLPHPRTGLISLFLPIEKLPGVLESGTNTGILEVQAISPPDERCWILNEEIISDGKMLVMTPIDPAFLLLPLINIPEETGSQNFRYRTSDDIFQEVALRFGSNEGDAETGTPYLQNDLLQFCSLECTRKAMPKLYEVKEVSAEIVVYRYSSSKSIEYLRGKVMHLEASTAFDASRTMTRNLAKDGLMDDGQESLLKLGRLRACCDLIGQYLSPEIRDALVNSYDFTALNRHIAAEKEEAMSRAAAATKREATAKKETAGLNKKRKAGKPSQGVENLKRVNTSGMAKISSFFNKKA